MLGLLLISSLLLTWLRMKLKQLRLYVNKFIIKKRTFYIQMEKGEIETSETEIVVADMENEDRIEVPNEDVEHGQKGADSKTSGSKNKKIQ